jgi:diadenosine tetraphosphate (Ap4A) HIT family hydrolase
MIHPQLVADCHLIGRFEICTLLLNRNASIPWFILVPEAQVLDYLDLPEPVRSVVAAESALVSDFLKSERDCSKVNFAGLGNVVPQLHLHVIGRRVGDACWPKPVWGNLPEEPEYDAGVPGAWRDLLCRNYGLCRIEG